MLFMALCFYSCSGQESGIDMERIVVDESGSHFAYVGSGKKFLAWGFNYANDASGRLIEEYWHQEWNTVEEDFREMKELGANVVRIHLQFNKFMKSKEEPDRSSLEQLSKLLRIANETGLYLDITGLASYYKQDVPEWYDQLDEAGRWEVQARFWEEIAKVCSSSPVVFCYDLMNEPALPRKNKKETGWLIDAGELAGKSYVQRISLDLAGRHRNEVAKAWVDKMTMAIRKHDRETMITLGVIPYNMILPGAKRIFYTGSIHENLDFVSVHFYPRAGKKERAIECIHEFEIGKPLVVEEFFPLTCSIEEMNTFIDSSRTIVDGYMSFYWGQTIEEYHLPENIDPDSMTRERLIEVGIGTWLEYIRDKTAEMIISQTK